MHLLYEKMMHLNLHVTIPSVAEAREWMRWIMDNTTFDQLILEHNTSGSHWIHVSCKPNPEDNRHQVISTLLKKS